MLKIYKKTDIVKIKINDIVIGISPLSKQIKDEVIGILQQANNDKVNMFKLGQQASVLAMKHGLKELNNAFLPDGSLYSLSFENGTLSDDCIDELLNCEINQKILMCCNAFIVSVPSKIVDENGVQIDGVEIKN